MDIDTQTMSTDVDSISAVLTPSPTASDSDLLDCSPRCLGRNTRTISTTSSSYSTSKTSTLAGMSVTNSH